MEHYCAGLNGYPTFPAASVGSLEENSIVQSERTESGMLTKSGSVRLPEGKKIVFNLSEDNVFQNRASDVSSGTRRLPTH